MHLSIEQRDAVRLAASPNGISIIGAGAGTGKTTAEQAIRDVADRSGLTVIGLAPNWVAANELRQSIGVPAQAIAKWRHDRERGIAPPLDERTVLLVDEAGMVSNRFQFHSTLATVIPAIEAQVGATLTRIIADAGYNKHKAPETHRFLVYTAGQKRGMTLAIKRQMRRRAAVEPVIGHLKSDHRRDRNHLAGRIGDAANAVLAAVGYNFRRLQPGSDFGCPHSGSTSPPPNIRLTPATPPDQRFFTDDYLFWACAFSR